MPFTNVEKQRRFRARLLADPHKTVVYAMKRRQWIKKKEDGRYVPMVRHWTNYETLQKTTQHERREGALFAMVKCETGHEVCWNEVYVTVVSSLYCKSFWTDGLW